MKIFTYTKHNINYSKIQLNIYTNIVQPGVYTKTEIVEPINTNIGISFTQQHQQKVKEGNVYVYKDPRIKPIINEKIENNPQPAEHNVYDPRFYGYGTAYRTYIDNMTGQPRYYYDDVMVHRQNNYITRNNIDSFDFGPQNNEEQKYSNFDIRTLVHNTYRDNTIDFRTDLQTSLMQSINKQQWQRKKMPLRNY